jgi:TATA-binding protein-associated factor Taf7
MDADPNTGVKRPLTGQHGTPKTTAKKPRGNNVDDEEDSGHEDDDDDDDEDNVHEENDNGDNESQEVSPEDITTFVNNTEERKTFISKCASVFISQPIQLQLNTLKRNQKSLTIEVLVGQLEALDKEFPNMNRQMWQRTGYAIMAAFFLSSVRIYSYL